MEERRKFILKYFEEHEGKELPKDEQVFYQQREVGAPSPADIEEKKRGAKAKEKPKQPKKREGEEELWLKEREEKGPAKSAALAKIQKLSNSYFESFAGRQEEGGQPNFDLMIKQIIPDIKAII